MGIIVNKEDNKNDDLSRRISADLRTRAMETAEVGDIDGNEPDFAEDAEYVKDLKKTSKFGWVWVVLIILAVLSLISIILI